MELYRLKGILAGAGSDRKWLLQACPLPPAPRPAPAAAQRGTLVIRVAQ